MEIDSEVLQRIRFLVRGGFKPKQRMMEIVCDELHAPGELDRNDVSAAIDAELQRLQIESAAWPALTDCDRLEAAFVNLRARGIVALHNAGYTQSDGYDDVLYYVEERQSRDRLSGYCFYHGQDLERAILGDGLQLAFGPLDPKREQSDGPGIGRLIVEELARAGLRTRWNGTFDQRISIPHLDWKMRRGEGRLADIIAAVREALAGGDRLCVTCEMPDAGHWVQFVGVEMHAAWPHKQDPGPLLAKIGNATVHAYEAGKTMTARMQTINAFAIATCMDSYFQLALDAPRDYSVSIGLEWL
jgi:hypothetical protein